MFRLSGERKFCRAIVRLGMFSRGCLGSVPANITDEAIGQALVGRKEVIKLALESLLCILPSHSSDISFAHRHKTKDKYVLWALHFEDHM
ncbi:hypothetical protein G9A89_015910 [Geosiphon pyriformis]|nr:hypothetical protein G9A89_015910 [Geosiphon pyriformis]